MSQQQNQNLEFLESKASAQEGKEREGDLGFVSLFRQRLSYHTFDSPTYSPKNRHTQEKQNFQLKFNLTNNF